MNKNTELTARAVIENEVINLAPHVRRSKYHGIRKFISDRLFASHFRLEISGACGQNVRLWAEARVQSRDVNQFFHTHFLRDPSDASGAIDVQLLKVEVLGFVRSADQIHDNVAVLHSLPYALLIFKVVGLKEKESQKLESL